MLDESTNALDGATEQEIINMLLKLRKKCHNSGGAQRGVVSNCDRVIMLDRGKVIADGSYSQLMSRSSAFRRLMSQVATSSD